MRGRKTDSEFISEFITVCVQSGIDTPEDIITHAKFLVSEIDEEIMRIEKRKITRSKLLDVISTFDRSNKTRKPEEIRVLSFFKIQHPQICKFICDSMKNNVITVEHLGDKYPFSDLIFCIKQLIEHKVISKSGSHLLRGEAFDEYLKFVLREE